MKTTLLALLVLVSSLSLSAQTWTQIYGHYGHQWDRSDSALRPPLLLVSSAPAGSIATFNDTLYVKTLAGSWVKVGATTQVPADWSSVSGPSFILNKPTLGTAAAKDVPATGNASSTQVVLGNDTRLSGGGSALADSAAALRRVIEQGQETYVGTIVSNRSYTAVSPFVAEGSITTTVSGGAIHLSGGANNLSQRLRYPWYTMLEKWVLSDSIVVKEKSSTSWGFALGLYSQNSSNPQSALFQFDMSTDAGTGKTTFWNGIYYTAYTTNAIAFIVGDTIRMTISRNTDTLTCVTTNVTQKQFAITKVIYDFQNLPYLPNTGNPTLFSVGGQFDLIGFNYSSRQTKYSPLAIDGNSKAQGYFTTNKYQRFPWLNNTHWQNTVNLSGGGDRMEELLLRRPELLLLMPKQVAIDGLRNSIASGDTTTAFANYLILVHTLDSAGIRPIHLTPQWESNAAIQVPLLASRNWVIRTFPDSSVIDIYKAIKDCGNACVYTDSVHMTDLGNRTQDSAMLLSGKIKYGTNKFFVPESIDGLQVVNMKTIFAQTYRQSGDPAKLLSNKELYIGPFDFRFRGTGDSVNVTHTGDIGITGNFTIPLSTSSKGIIYQGTNRLITVPGLSNTFFGTNSGNVSVTGANNTAMGYNSLLSATSSADNVAVGVGASQSETSGHDNVAIGSSAGFQGAGHINTVLIGSKVGQNATNSTNFYNTIIGSFALQSTSAGNSNTVIGEHGLYQCVGCTGITALGRYAGGSATTATANKAFFSAYGDGAAGRNIGDNWMYADFTNLFIGLGNNSSPTAFLHLAASTTVGASLRIPAGTAPTSPNDGDIWNDNSTHHVNVRLNGVTYQLDQQSGSGSSGISFPTITNSSNAASITSDSAVWAQSGPTVEVDGHFTVTPTSGTVNTIVNVGIPVNSLLTGGHASWGVVSTSQTTNGFLSGVIVPSGTANSNVVVLTIGPTGGTSSLAVYYHYSYRVQ